MAYNILAPVHIISAVSMGATITSNAVEIKLQDNIGVQLIWTGTPTGDFSIQVSNNHLEDINGNIKVAGNWTAITLSPTVPAEGASGDAYINITEIAAPYIRIVYTRTSGTGTLDAYVVGKGV